MKNIFLLFFVVISFYSSILAQDTFSIVAADSSTREVGSAGASCVNLFDYGGDICIFQVNLMVIG